MIPPTRIDGVMDVIGVRRGGVGRFKSVGEVSGVILMNRKTT
jgi:hypothetical protein